MPLTNYWPVKDFGLKSYAEVQAAMEAWARSSAPSEIWVGEHPTVITQGVRAQRQQLSSHYFPVIPSSRGGLLSLHLPGQLVFYPLYRFEKNCDLPCFVTLLERCVLQYLQQLGIYAYRCVGAPGVYTKKGKISSLGLRMRPQGIIHGLSLNIQCPLQPFQQLISCGYKEMPITNLASHDIFPKISSVKKELTEIFISLFEQEFTQ